MLEVAAIVRGYAFRYVTEAELHDGVEEALRLAGLRPRREVRIGRDRLDLLVGGVAVEIKVKGGDRPLLGQAERYLAHDEVEGLVVVTSRVRHLRLPESIAGKPVVVVTLAAAGL